MKEYIQRLFNLRSFGKKNNTWEEGRNFRKGAWPEKCFEHPTFTAIYQRTEYRSRLRAYSSRCVLIYWAGSMF